MSQTSVVADNKRDANQRSFSTRQKFENMDLSKPRPPHASKVVDDDSVIDLTVPGLLRGREIDLTIEYDDQIQVICSGCNHPVPVQGLVCAVPCGHCLCEECSSDGLSRDYCDECLLHVDRSVRLYYDGECAVCLQQTSISGLICCVPCGHCVCRTCHERGQQLQTCGLRCCSQCRNDINDVVKPKM